jgi:hypothetical protein
LVKTSSAFALEGDSGALVVTEGEDTPPCPQPIGIVVVGNKPGTRTYLSPISEAFSQLGKASGPSNLSLSVVGTCTPSQHQLADYAQVDPDIAAVENVLNNPNYQTVFALYEAYSGLLSETVDMSVTPAALDLEFDNSTNATNATNGSKYFVSNYAGVPTEVSVEETLQAF